MCPVQANAPKSELEITTIRRTAKVLIPFLMIGYLISFIDRVNAGFAAFQMNKALGMTASIFGFGSGLYFWTYFLFEVPSNLVMQRVGARRWLARIMVTWGIISAATAFAVGPKSYCAIRLLLGAAEAGFFPGVLLYLTYWFPAEYRARMVSMFYLAVPVSSFVGSPISAALLQMHGIAGLQGWQWLFILEAAPAVMLGAICLFALPDRPVDARFLSDEQRAWLIAKLAEEQKQVRAVHDHRVFAVLFNPKVLLLALVYAGTSAATNGLSIWQPQIIKSFGLTTMQTGLLNSVPFAVACIVMVIWGRYSDRPGKRISSAVMPLALSVFALCFLVLSKDLWVVIILLSLTLIGTFSFKGPFWALSSETLGASAAAAGLAMINAVGNLGGFFGTYMIGLLRDRTGSFLFALSPILVCEAVGCLIVIAIGRQQKRLAEATQLTGENYS